MQPGDWLYSPAHQECCRVLEVFGLWGQETSLVWFPGTGRVVRLDRARLEPIDAVAAPSGHQLVYVAAAARIVEALAADTLVAPLEGTVIPLPHQLQTLQRAMSGDRIRFLLADEVGLGKTIEAGLILRELKLRGLVRRALVVAPAGLVTQWVSEMKTHFAEDFRPLQPATLEGWRQMAGLKESDNLWTLHDQVVCPLDSVKPVDQRRGWSPAELASHNRERFQDLVGAGWDLVIFDEAHRLSGSTDEVARYRLAESLADAVPYVLLLSATPHQGKTDAFRRLIGLLDPLALPDAAAVRRENVAPYVIRTEKRHAIDADGQPLFKPRTTQLVRVPWAAARPSQRALYDAVTEYVRIGYNRARRERRSAVGFLMILMQRLVTSSTAAIRASLEGRLAALQDAAREQPLLVAEAQPAWGDAQPSGMVGSPFGEDGLAVDGERSEVEALLAATRRCEAEGPDAKAEALLDWVQALCREEADPGMKVLVFTEFVATQGMLVEFLEQRGFTVERLHGSMDLEERQRAQVRFAGEAQILISTDAGGEGLNLQFAHVVINYDLPWNPMKIEQRIGRVDRIGQRHVVRALNFALDDTVELRVREVLEEKLRRILEEFGVDKLGDVLDSDESGIDFEGLYMDAVLAPGDAERRAEALVEDVRRRAQAARDAVGLFGAPASLDARDARRVAEHPVALWTERMTLAFLQTRAGLGARVAASEFGHDLRWPDGHEVNLAVFSRQDAELPGAIHLTLEDPRVRGLLKGIPRHLPGQPIAAAVLPGVSEHVSGTWSLWRVVATASDQVEERFLAVFLSDDGRTLLPTGRVVWDRLIEQGERLQYGPTVDGAPALAAFASARAVAEEQGGGVFAELAAGRRERTQRERQKMSQVFAARRRAIERVGLPQVRAYRLAQLAEEERAWSDQASRWDQLLPDLSAVALLRVLPGGGRL